jgi:predicted acetyltransferase
VTLGGLEIREFGPADDVEAELDLRRRSFGPIRPPYKPAWLASVRATAEAGQMIGVFDGGRLVGSARYHAMRQWWRGRSMPMAGVAGVKVAPEERGRGVGKAMLARLLAQIADRGYPVSALFPTTAGVYRSAGWEFAGGKYEVVLPARALAALVPAGPNAGQAAKIRRATPADGALIVEVKGRVHDEMRHCGPNTRDPAELRIWLDDEDHFGYLADDGFLSYRWSDGTAAMEVEELIAISPATARAFWQILSSHATMAERVRACVAPDDPVSWLTRDPDAALRRREHWMLRLVDAPAAIAARGYPTAVTASAELEISDPMLPGNSGRWTLAVSGGEARLERPGSSANRSVLRLGSRGLAAMFGGVPLATLRQVGLASGGDSGTDDVLDSVFAGPTFMIDYF